MGREKLICHNFPFSERCLPLGASSHVLLLTFSSASQSWAPPQFQNYCHEAHIEITQTLHVGAMVEYFKTGIVGYQCVDLSDW